MTAREIEEEDSSWFSNPTVGTGLTILSGLAFLFVCMLLPLVGQAASQVHYTASLPGDIPMKTANFFVFLAVLTFCLALSILAVLSKLARRKIDGSPLPRLSMILLSINVVLMVALLTGLLSI